MCWVASHEGTEDAFELFTKAAESLASADFAVVLYTTTSIATVVEKFILPLASEVHGMKRDKNNSSKESQFGRKGACWIEAQTKERISCEKYFG